MAKLPGNKEGKLIQHMKVGEIGYTLPWGMWVDKQRECWLKENYPIYKEKHGTAVLKIERLREGYIAYINDIDYKWDVESESGYFASDESKLHGKVIGFNHRDSLEDRLKEAIESDNYEEAARIKKELEGKK